MLVGKPNKQAMQRTTGFSKPTWRTPPTGCMKCNVDGAFDPRTGQGATGVVLWNHSDSFVSGRARWYLYGLDSLALEALAYKDGVLLAMERGVQRLQVEADSQNW